METIVIFGKGGIGKSMVATNLSYAFAERGLRVLHVGCDPKADSCNRLTHGEDVPPVIEEYLRRGAKMARSDIIRRGVAGIDCVESGGPEPGVGCGGRGITLMFQAFEEIGFFDRAEYDVAVFDVLGDIVCGGFAAPLRRGYGKKIFIVMSEEPMAMYAANNIARAVNTYSKNGVALGGIILNMRDNDTPLEPIDRFMSTLNTRIVGVVRRDTLIVKAEREWKTVLEHAPDSEPSTSLRKLADDVLALDITSVPLPTPMTQKEFNAFVREM